MHRIMAVREVLCVWYSLEVSTGQVADPSLVSLSSDVRLQLLLQFYVNFTVVQMFAPRAFSKTSISMRREIQEDRSMGSVGS
jgi:hypothetical protein